MTYAMNIREHELAAQRFGQKLGEIKKTISAIRVFRENMNDNMLMKGFDIDKKTLDNILEMLDNYPDRTDEEIAYELSSNDDNE